MKTSRLAAGPPNSREATRFGVDSGGKRGAGRSTWASEKRGSGEKILITKGDNNDVNDPMPVRANQVKGKLYYVVPFVGYLADAVGNADRDLWITAAAAGLIGVSALLIFRTVRRRERAAG